MSAPTFVLKQCGRTAPRLVWWPSDVFELLASAWRILGNLVSAYFSRRLSGHCLAWHGASCAVRCSKFLGRACVSHMCSPHFCVSAILGFAHQPQACLTKYASCPPRSGPVVGLGRSLFFRDHCVHAICCPLGPLVSLSTSWQSTRYSWCPCSCNAGILVRYPVVCALLSLGRVLLRMSQEREARVRRQLESWWKQRVAGRRQTAKAPDLTIGAATVVAATRPVRAFAPC